MKEAKQPQAPAMLTVTAQAVEDTMRLAAALAAHCQVTDCLLLSGDLGSGKTTFARGFIGSLRDSAEKEEIVSPTFTLVQQYLTHDARSLYHFDLYRLKQAGELADIGLEEALQTGITLIEWPALAEIMVPTTALAIHILMAANGDSRQFRLQGNAHIWQQRLAAVEKQFYTE